MAEYGEKFPLFGRLDSSFSEYVRTRAVQYASWYDAKAVGAKRNYLWSRTIVAVGAVLSPFLASHHVLVDVGLGPFDIATVGAAIVGLLIAVLVAMEGIFKFQEQWKNYRTTEQYICTQIFMFGYGVDDFANLSTDDGFKLFVRSVEMSIKNENEVTLNVLTRVSGNEPSSPSKESLV